MSGGQLTISGKYIHPCSLWTYHTNKKRTRTHCIHSENLRLLAINREIVEQKREVRKEGKTGRARGVRKQSVGSKQRKVNNRSRALLLVAFQSRFPNAKVLPLFLYPSQTKNRLIFGSMSYDDVTIGINLA